MSVIDEVLAYVDRQIGKSYSQSNRYGENSFDCSSLIYRAFDAAGVKLVHKDTGGKVDISSNVMQKVLNWFIRIVMLKLVKICPPLLTLLKNIKRVTSFFVVQIIPHQEQIKLLTL